MGQSSHVSYAGSANHSFHNHITIPYPYIAFFCIFWWSADPHETPWNPFKPWLPSGTPGASNAASVIFSNWMPVFGGPGTLHRDWLRWIEMGELVVMDVQLVQIESLIWVVHWSHTVLTLSDLSAGPRLCQSYSLMARHCFTWITRSAELWCKSVWWFKNTLNSRVMSHELFSENYFRRSVSSWKNQGIYCCKIGFLLERWDAAQPLTSNQLKN